ncbi:MAG: hypothetical protein J5X22_00515 [Candidatus Accumulibacter sp.]|uniref:hypothetical protein n=1 Tax=Accumulibacter sp. TaxID=2053492 RepID=UPI001B254274|nr:hypothetical protein [Accumulibacter sp.]MBO3709044.1 hypothetical protein [Accumulibacter sp.]
MTTNRRRFIAAVVAGVAGSALPGIALATTPRQAAEPYLISDGGSRPRRYSLGLRPAAVSYDTFQAPQQIGATISNILPGA